MKSSTKIKQLIFVGFIALLAGFAWAQTQDTVYLVTFKRVTTIPQSCSEGRLGCAVYHCKYDTSKIMTKIFYEGEDADEWIEGNKNNWMWEAIEIKKEKLVKARANKQPLREIMKVIKKEKYK